MVALVICAGLSAQSVSITDLPEIARARAERQRAVQEQALESFWADLSLSYEVNPKFLDERMAEVVALGDSAVPLLLEKLAPDVGSQQHLQLAANCARVLALMDPASFSEDLMNLATGESWVARSHAITLMGHTASERSARFLLEILPELLTDDDRLRSIEALTRLRAGQAADVVVTYLDGSEPLRRAVLDFLNATSPASPVETVVRSLADETEGTLLRHYIDYLGKVVRADGAVAEGLVQLFGDERLELASEIALCRALATIAPQNHEPTTGSLRRILEQGQMGELGQVAAVALHKLGDRKGAAILASRLDANVRRQRNSSDAWSERADLHFALDSWQEAIADYRQAAKLGTRRETRIRCQLRIARCEAHRGRWKNVLTALKDSRATRTKILLEAEQDPVLERALDEEIIRRWLETLRSR
jgi:tetratricopeptide (TPR) repeat protein